MTNDVDHQGIIGCPATDIDNRPDGRYGDEYQYQGRRERPRYLEESRPVNPPWFRGPGTLTKSEDDVEKTKLDHDEDNHGPPKDDPEKAVDLIPEIGCRMQRRLGEFSTTAGRDYHQQQGREAFEPM
jgi:hypothetical protein